MMVILPVNHSTEAIAFVRIVNMNEASGPLPARPLGKNKCVIKGIIRQQIQMESARRGNEYGAFLSNSFWSTHSYSHS